MCRYLTSAKKEKAFIWPIHSSWIYIDPKWSLFLFLCTHKSVCFFLGSWILSPSSYCKSHCMLQSSFGVSHSPYSSRFVKHALYLQTLWLPGCVIPGIADWSFRGLKYSVPLYKISFPPPHRTWNQRGVGKTIFSFTSVPVIHRELQRMYLLDSVEYKEPLWLLLYIYHNFNSFWKFMHFFYNVLIGSYW